MSRISEISIIYEAFKAMFSPLPALPTPGNTANNAIDCHVRHGSYWRNNDAIFYFYDQHIGYTSITFGTNGRYCVNCKNRIKGVCTVYFEKPNVLPNMYCNYFNQEDYLSEFEDFQLRLATSFLQARKKGKTKTFFEDFIMNKISLKVLSMALKAVENKKEVNHE